MKRYALVGIVGAFLVFLVPVPAFSALVDRGYVLIFDDTLGVTRLQDATYPATQYAETACYEGVSDGRKTRLETKSSDTWVIIFIQ